MKCLIAEDDRTTSTILKQMISKYGPCDSVTDGTQAIEMFRLACESDSPYDLILMDIIMPETDGLQAVLEIRKIESLMGIALAHRVKVLVATSLNDPRTVMKALYEADANFYLNKPITPQTLEVALRKLNLIP